MWIKEVDMSPDDKTTNDSDWTPAQRASLKSGLKTLAVIIVVVFITALVMSLISARVGG